MNPKTESRDPNSRVKLLESIFYACHTVSSIPELEKRLTIAMSEVLPISGLRISFRDSNITTHGFHDIPLEHEGMPIGTLRLLLQEKRKLRKEDRTLLEKVASLISVTIDRLAKTEEAELLKKQWQTTFDSMQEPVALLSPDYKIIRANQSYADLAQIAPNQLAEKKCHEALFGRSSPCRKCKLGESFELSQVGIKGGEIKTLEVRTQSLQRSPLRAFVVHYEDITSRRLYESRLIESAKLAELGTIGSSIAHELNNPIAGMLTFVQLLKMDLTGSESFYQDVIEIEKGILRCRDIVRNLLTFSRQESLEDTSPIDLYKVIEQAKSVIELQAQWKGIPFVVSGKPEKPLVIGNHNLLVQAFVHLLQDSVEAIGRRKLDEPQVVPRVEIRMQMLDLGPVIELIDNGLPPKGLGWQADVRPGQSLSTQTAIPGLSRTLAFQIIQQHGGTLEFLENADIRPDDSISRRAKISFVRPVF